MAFSRVRVGCIAVVAISLALVGAQVAPSGATSRSDSATRASSGLHSHSLCWERDYTDPRGDAPVDATSYRLSYDCQSARWTFSAALTAPATRTNLDALEVAIDTDGNRSNGCAGWEFIVAGVFDEDSGVPLGEVFSTPSCTTNTWIPVATASFSAAGNGITLSFLEASLNHATRLNWGAGIDAVNTAADELPDNGAHSATDFLQQTGASDGYWLVDAAGGVHAYGNAPSLGDLGSTHLAQPIVSMTGTPARDGYWLLGRDGGVFTFGHADFFGSTGGIHLNKPVVALASTTTGLGYWFVASDGGIFSFGDAKFHGSTGAIKLNKPIVGMAATPSGGGYWLVASDGGIFSFGDAKFHGSTGALHLTRPIIAMVATPSGNGYWLLAADGGVFSFGDAGFFGSTGALRLVSPVVGMTVSPTGHGYRFVAADGGIFSFGDAVFLGGLGGGKPPSPVVAMS